MRGLEVMPFHRPDSLTALTIHEKVCSSPMAERYSHHAFHEWDRVNETWSTGSNQSSKPKDDGPFILP
jgi:hypothetical protein